MMHVESPMHVAEENPPGNNVVALAISLVQINSRKSSALGIVSPVFNPIVAFSGHI